jgi:hypothetical protein
MNWSEPRDTITSEAEKLSTYWIIFNRRFAGIRREEVDLELGSYVCRQIHLETFFKTGSGVQFLLLSAFGNMIF